MKDIISGGDSNVEIEREKYYLSLIEKPETTEEVVEMINQREL